jgi:hypothetical protein
MTSGWKTLNSIALCLTLTFLACAAASHADDTTGPLRMPITLSQAGDHSTAALEFRRQALNSLSLSNKAALFWSAAHEYHRAGAHKIADKMLDAAENADPSLLAPASLLRGETATAIQDWPASSFYFQSLASTAGNSNMTRFASRRLAVSELHRQNMDAARLALSGSGPDETPSIAALDQYSRGHDKKPWIGGVLGLIPGLGYAYSGEYANAGRSLILNSLFIYGMVNTAENESWGAFAAISFFELTWYSGSIYGGIDAAHRYNQDRLDACSQGIMNNASFNPNYSTLPALTIQFQF